MELAQSQHAGRFHPSRTTTDDDNRATIAVFLQIIKFDFPGRAGIDGAADRHAISQDPFPAIETADALPDFITVACAGLFDKIRIGQLGPAQSDKITNAFFKECFGKFWIFDGIRRNDRNVEHFFIRLRHMLFPARTVRIGFTIGIGIAGTAITDINGIYAA